MLCRVVQVLLVLSVAIAYASCTDYRRHRERYNRRSYDDRPIRQGHSILSRGEDGQGYELQLDGDSHITSYLKALDVPEPLSRNPHIIASFDESLIPAAVARRIAQRRASEAEAAAASLEVNQSTSNSTSTSDEAKSKEKGEPIESPKQPEIVANHRNEALEKIHQEKDMLMVNEPEALIKKNKEEQINPLESRLQIGGRLSDALSEGVRKYEDVVEEKLPAPLRESPVDKRPTFRVTSMNTQEFKERGRGSTQEPREFVLLMDSDRSENVPTLYGNLRPRSRSVKKNLQQQSKRQSVLVPVPLEQSIRDLRSQTFRAAQLGQSPSQMSKVLQIVPDEPETRLRGHLVQEVREERGQRDSRDQRIEPESGIDEVRYPKSSRSPLVNSCLQLCSCCSALLGKNLVPLLV